MTGGDTGIGKGISTVFAQNGCKVAINYHGERAPADGLVRDIESFGGVACAVGGDVSFPGDVENLVASAVDAYGRLDVMVNNAGVEQKAAFVDMSLDDYARTVAVNLTGAWLGSQYAARQMIAQKSGGRIIMISSVHEEISMPTNAAYCATKGALRMLTRTICVELAPHGITVNNVCPGAIDTPMDANLKKQPEKWEKLLDEIPLHRMGKPEEIAQLCMYLASDDAVYVTGASIFIDGGMSKKSGSL